IPKVFSKTLEHADRAGTRIARGGLAEEIGRLKREGGNDLIAYGGARFDQAAVTARGDRRGPAHHPAGRPRPPAAGVQGPGRLAASIGRARCATTSPSMCRPMRARPPVSRTFNYRVMT